MKVQYGALNYGVGVGGCGEIVGNQNGEELPKLVPPGGSGFSGIPNDFPVVRKHFYQSNSFVQSTWGACGEDSHVRDSHIRHKVSPDSPAPTPRLQQSASAPNLAFTHPRTPKGYQQSYENLGQHPRGRRPHPESLRQAGVSTFEMRRFQQVNTSMPFL